VLDYTKTLDLTAGGDSETANYAQLYRGLDLRRRGPGTDERLAGWANWRSAWTKNLAAYLESKLSETDLIGRAGADVQDAKSQNREKAEAYYFVGRVHLIAGDTAEARRNFAASVALQFPADVGRKLAQAELDRMPAM
jgi:lipoprotein NlpI